MHAEQRVHRGPGRPPTPAPNSRGHATHAETKAGAHAGSFAVAIARTRPAPPGPLPGPAPSSADLGCRGPHLADQLPAPVHAPRARVAQEDGDQRAATAPPPPPPPRFGLHPSREPGGAGALAQSRPGPPRAALLWGPRAAWTRLIGRGGRGGVQTLGAASAGGGGRVLGRGTGGSSGTRAALAPLHASPAPVPRALSSLAPPILRLPPSRELSTRPFL